MAEAVVVGTSAGGLQALIALLAPLRREFDKAIIIVQHVQEGSDDFLVQHLNRLCALDVKEANEKESVLPGVIYIAPAGYHLLIEDDRTFSLSDEPKVCYARPSIDVLFESAADVYEEKLIGIILTGANSDGAQGLHAVGQAGGITIVQNPETAQYPVMPREASKTVQVDHVLELSEIVSFLIDLQNS